MRSTLRNASCVKSSSHIIDAFHLNKTSFTLYQKHHTNLFQIYHSDRLSHNMRRESNVIDSKIIKSMSKKLYFIVKTSNLKNLSYVESSNLSEFNFNEQYCFVYEFFQNKYNLTSSLIEHAVVLN